MKLTEAILYVAYKEGPLTKEELVEKVANLLNMTDEKRKRAIKAWIGKLVKLGKTKNTRIEVNVDGEVKRLKLVEENGKYKAVE